MSTYYRDLGARLKDSLGVPRPGDDIPWLVALRTMLQMASPHEDELTKRVWKLFQDHRHEMRGDVLDAGCYGGWVYGHLMMDGASPLNYHGIDLWEGAVRGAQFMFPGVKFEVYDLMNLAHPYDVIWCSQIVWTGNDAERAVEHLKRWTRKLLVFESPSLSGPVVWRP